jgi:predicted DNA-binding protein (MmcQ/YjbR family)
VYSFLLDPCKSIPVDPTADHNQREAALERLRLECGGWPGVIETLTWGNPTFKANGKAFAVLDRYRSSDCIWVRCGSEKRADLLLDEAYFPAPYDKHKLAVCRSLERLDWASFCEVLRHAYEDAMPG